MSDLYTQLNTSTPDPEEKKGRKWRILLFILFIFMIITTGFAGYILGKGSRFSDNMTGKAIDTIHVTQPGAKIHLGGKIFYSDGSPYAKGTVQIHSEPRKTITDDFGAFVFENTEGGSHTLSIIDSKGNVLAEREVNISKEEIEEGARISLLKDDTYQVEVAVDIKYLEIQVMILKEDGRLYINPDKVTYLTEDGIVVSPTGKADIRSGVVVTPVGNVITTDGTIICGSGDKENHKVIIPSGSLTNMEDGTIQAPDGTQVRPDGTVIHNDTVIYTGGTSMTPDGNKQEPGEGGYQILSDANKVLQVPIGKDTEKLIGANKEPPSRENQGTNVNNQGGNNSVGSTIGANPPSNDTAGSGTTGSDTPGTGTPEPNMPGNDDPGTYTPDPDIPDPDVPGPDVPGPDVPGPDTPKPDEPDNGVKFAGGTSEQLMTAWEQETEIDLFYNRTAGQDDVTLLSPGAEGYYLFRINNDNHFSVSIDLAVSEKDLHLPLEFAIADSRGNLLTSWQAAAGKEEVYTDKITLKKRGEEIYQIKWRWPYHTSDEQDAADTMIGELKNHSYTVNLHIRAVQQ